MIARQFQRRSYTNSRCRGIALVAVLVLFAVSLTLFGLWAKSAVRERQRMASELFRLQAERLAEAGVHRAVARRAADPQYDNEIWLIPAESLGGTRGAEVRIRVSPKQDAAAVRIEATASYPSHSVRHAEITKRIEILNPSTEDET